MSEHEEIYAELGTAVSTYRCSCGLIFHDQKELHAHLYKFTKSGAAQEVGRAVRLGIAQEVGFPGEANTDRVREMMKDRPGFCVLKQDVLNHEAAGRTGVIGWEVLISQARDGDCPVIRCARCHLDKDLCSTPPSAEFVVAFYAQNCPRCGQPGIFDHLPRRELHGIETREGTMR